MVCLFYLSLVMLIGMNMAFIHNDIKFQKHHMNRLFRSNEEQRALRNIMGKLIDTETNTIYSIDGQKQHGSSSSNVAKSDASTSIGLSPRFIEDLACLEACYKCVEDYPFASRKKKAADNCGPMCDCADSCNRMPIEQIDKIYGQSASARGGKDCFLQTYTQSLKSEVPSFI
ncbi:unnamed protein product [Adineta steineri]|uniref:Uncharacterized protein n=1 Tax=Adineta steineri TaxID=433720 RepID=A0A815CAT4_9BILA|nr:unnamed protein product [Adineta steineri]CAF1284731.1 unnamed protein product [Adineta steineri]CAF1287641.1 unnamed protein product [Adineta steineri]CAF1386949.1 unnamed protein product [Adineta steineri]CAF1393847.1 unnamed protein product [Adineta steineri]